MPASRNNNEGKCFGGKFPPPILPGFLLSLFSHNNNTQLSCRVVLDNFAAPTHATNRNLRVWLAE